MRAQARVKVWSDMYRTVQAARPGQRPLRKKEFKEAFARTNRFILIFAVRSVESKVEARAGCLLGTQPTGSPKWTLERRSGYARRWRKRLCRPSGLGHQLDSLPSPHGLG